jgi:two-component system phosphate regulon sensor histidine kinase PhoR
MVGVLYNLFDNALKYSKDPVIIDIKLGKQHENLVISIADKGIGIPAAYRKKIFDKFFRVPHGDTHNIKGYGLGLSYVCEVITRHGGTIEAMPREEVGTEFIITLPAIKTPLSAIA